MTYSLAIFDLDGTLIDYEGASNKGLSVPLAKRGKDFNWELHAKIVGTKPRLQHELLSMAK